jgi:hypothetical protein
MPAERTHPGYIKAFLDWLESTGALNAPKVQDKPFTELLEYDAGGKLIYHGMAVAGSGPAVASWQIKKLAWDAGGKLISLQYANGAEDFNSVWNNRAALPYS